MLYAGFISVQTLGGVTCQPIAVTSSIGVDDAKEAAIRVAQETFPARSGYFAHMVGLVLVEQSTINRCANN